MWALLCSKTIILLPLILLWISLLCLMRTFPPLFRVTYIDLKNVYSWAVAGIWAWRKGPLAAFHGWGSNARPFDQSLTPSYHCCLPETYRFCAKIDCHLGFSMILSGLSTALVPVEEKQLHDLMLPPLSYTMALVRFGWCPCLVVKNVSISAVFYFGPIRSCSVFQKKKRLWSSPPYHIAHTCEQYKAFKRLESSL